MSQDRVKFGVFTDLHLDIMHDGERRLGAFLQQMQTEEVDFIIQLGDFCYPEGAVRCLCSAQNMPVNLKNAMAAPASVPKLKLLRQFNQFPKPHYHTLGNHEFDFCTKAQAMRFYGMERRYYSFVCKGWKFMVLDANHYRAEDGRIRPYNCGDYFDSKDLPYIDDEQLAWIAAELAADELPLVIFSHQPLNEHPRGIRNYRELAGLFRQANRLKKRVRLCMNGHTHLDELSICEGIAYYTLNSMSNHWVGPAHECRRFGAELEQAFPNLKYTFPYQKPLFALVSLSAEGAEISGQAGDFIEPSPQRLGYTGPASPSILSCSLRW